MLKFRTNKKPTATTTINSKVTQMDGSSPPHKIMVLSRQNINFHRNMTKQQSTIYITNEGEDEEQATRKKVITAIPFCAILECSMSI